MPHSNSFQSVFEKTFDCVVLGAGIIGWSAARRLAGEGLQVLLVEPSYSLLWESSLALENSMASAPDQAGPDEWNARLQAVGASNGQWFNPAAAEVLAARELLDGQPNLQTLLTAHPVGARLSQEGLIATVTVATKGGLREIHGRSWIDASETGWLVDYLAPEAPQRSATSVYRSILLHSAGVDLLDAAAAEWISETPGIEWLPSHRPDERRLRFLNSGSCPWFTRAKQLIEELRGRLAEDSKGQFLVSLCGSSDYPVYTAEVGGISRLPENLVLLSPTRISQPVCSLADRFALGREFLLPANLPTVIESSESSAPRVTDMAGFEVVVAGTGTGGAVAAIVSGKNGARTIAFDAVAYPGGIGTGGGIHGYFHGVPGGIQDLIDSRTRELGERFTIGNHPGAGWHPEAKKIVLLEMFEEAGVEFVPNAMLSGVERDGNRVTSALVAIEGRLVRIAAKAFIDGTGDGDLCAFAGAKFVEGRPGDGRTLAFSQSGHSVTASPAGTGFVLRGYNYDAGWTDPANSEDLTRARLSGVAHYLEHENWGIENHLIDLCPLLGLRQSRQIHCDYEISLSDLIERARFEDSIGEVATVADTHSVDFEFESDDLAFYYWTCRGFRYPLRCDLPYRILLPRGLDNVWLACRAAGMSVDAAYGLRMQREMQRFGETAGTAAALAVQSGVPDSRLIDSTVLFGKLKAGGCLTPRSEPVPAAVDDPLERFKQGLPGIHLWLIRSNPEKYGPAMLEFLDSSDGNLSFYAAAVLAMQGDARAEARLLRALETEETGPSPDAQKVPGAHGQCIDLPFWLQAVVLLRIAGTSDCLPHLLRLAEKTGLLLNVRTILALTLERLALRLGPFPGLENALMRLVSDKIPDPILPPSRSLWRSLSGEPQLVLRGGFGAKVLEDHSWQLHLVVARLCRAHGIPLPSESPDLTADHRAIVREAH